MSTMNAVFLSGTLGADVEVRRCGHGSVAQLALATTYPVRTATGSEHRPTWIRVTVFGERAEALAGLGMGSSVHVRGRLRQTTFEGDGLRFQSLEVVAFYVKVREARPASPARNLDVVDAIPL